MPVIYDSNMIIPAPLARYTKSYQETADGTKVGSLFNITLIGTMVAHRGSPTSSGTLWTTGGAGPPDEDLDESVRLKAILKKQCTLRDLFSVDGKTLEIQPLDGSASWKCNPRVKSIEFEEGIWRDICKFTINLEADKVYLAGAPCSDDDEFSSPFISEASEEWTIEQEGDLNGVFRLTHNVTAKGKRFYSPDGTLSQEAWKQAREYVLPRLGLDPARLTSSGVLNLPSYMAGFNYLRSEFVNEIGGDYRVGESWVVTSGAAIETFTASTRTGTEDGRTACTIEGEIRGLTESNNTTYDLLSEKYTNANSHFTNSVVGVLYTRANAFTGLTLNPTALSQLVTRNQRTGVVTYNYTFDNRPVFTTAGALSENIQVNDDLPADVFARIAVLGRSLGPVLQATGASTGKRREISVEVVMPAKLYGGTTTEPNVDGIVSGYFPVATRMFLERDTKSWNPISGRLSRTVSLVYE
jgi:hypothetical protein